MDDFAPEALSNLVQVEHRHNGTIIQPTSDEINCMHWNINSLAKKLHHVEQNIACYPGTLHFVAISETRLTLSNVSTYQLKGYHAIHNVRHPAEGGGISFFVHDSLCSTTPKVLRYIYIRAASFPSC